ncbi:MAG: hypothetical protein KDA88_05235 [Planctomycetaceae bacterium]|nr:hypothetical protein [Planctomycetaceae bacterium]MCB9949705.1 hypothetical protein [Planctomycetaceae bacterium]
MSDIRIQAYLRQFAPVSRYFIVSKECADDGLILYLGYDNELYTLLDQDRTHMIQYSTFLLKQSCTTFTDMSSAELHIADLLACGPVEPEPTRNSQ